MGEIALAIENAEAIELFLATLQDPFQHMSELAF